MSAGGVVSGFSRMPRLLHVSIVAPRELLSYFEDAHMGSRALSLNNNLTGRPKKTYISPAS